MDQLRDIITDGWSQRPELFTKLLLSVLIALVLWGIHTLILRIVWRNTERVTVRYRWRKGSSYATLGAAVVLIGFLWLDASKSLGTFLGLLSAGLAIALRDLIADLAGWLFILWRRPFELGDRIEIGAHAGDVIDIRFFQFTLLEIRNWVGADQSTGRIIHIPNGKVLSDSIANYSKGFQYIWHEIPVLITFESNWRRAKELLLDIAQRHDEDLSVTAQQRVKEAARRFLIFYSTLTPTVYTTVRESGVLLTVRYLCEPRRRRGSEERIWEDVLDAFAKESDIALAYPTNRMVWLDSRPPDDQRQHATGTKPPGFPER
jgi:small-conductance mechanosensitive channel